MPRLFRNGVLIAGLCWVAPVAAQQAGGSDDECRYDNASSPVVIMADEAPGEVPLSEGRRAFLP